LERPHNRPLEIDGRNIKYAGWTLELTEGYGVTKDESVANYKLI